MFVYVAREIEVSSHGFTYEICEYPASRDLSGVSSKAPNWAARSELGRFPIHIKILTSIKMDLYHFINSQ